ncbi:hypothetical protein [Candidatus Cryosericum terrychapinii]|jgi:hypothetical protein|uniref:Uncharacterized protein n=1 Tax=Candidatus Cryosericum terrychapinii TaxID=2290919 RepID=A0A398D2Z0_9BACT|nr:hypothetical protein [Candidatus Cryosericum terrychapinii]RIE06607.1 hypothetical protein SMC7_00945 [Candidatus Cryosericum terrychapinii]
MNQQPSSVLDSMTTPQPTEVRLKPPTVQLQERPAAFDPTQIAGAAAYAILLYLGILYGLSLLSGAAGMVPRLQSAIALIGSLLLTGAVFGVMAVLRDRLARRPAGPIPEQIIRLDDALRWLVPADLMVSYTDPMTMFRLNLLDLLATADNAQQRVPAAAYAAWPVPLDHLAAAVFTAYYGIPNPDVDPFVSQDTVELGRYLAERHQA